MRITTMRGTLEVLKEDQAPHDLELSEFSKERLANSETLQAVGGAVSGQTEKFYDSVNYFGRYKQNRLIELFIAGSTARTASALVGVNKTTASYYFQRLRQLIYDNSDLLEVFGGEIEADESYFGGHRKGKRGRGAAGKVPVFGLLKRNGKVYTVIIPNTKTDTLLPIIRERVQPDSIVYTDTYKSYNALDVSEFRHFRINHSEVFADKLNHINGIENFWNQAKRHLCKFNGIPRDHFHLFLKECEWRFNHSDPREQLRILKQLVKGV